MRPKRAFGRPGTQVIPVNWGADHAAVVEGDTGVLTLTIAWRRPGGTAGSFNPATLTKTVTPNTAHHTGPADVQLLPQLQQERLLAEDDLVSTVGYRVTVTHDAGTDGTDFQVGDVGTVTAADGNGDASLVGKDLIVRAIERPSHGWSRYLICTERVPKT